MAIFKKSSTAKAAAEKKESIKATKTLVTTKEKETSTKAGHSGLDLTMVLLRPHVTEKASDLSEHRVYAFEINKRANKMHVRLAVEKFYKVKPVKVAVINGAGKVMKNPKTGRVQLKKQGVKKALVYLKKGDKIEFV